MENNANNILFRCSSLGHLMTEGRSKSDPLSETTKTHLVDIFVSAKYGRNTDIENRYTKKGLMVEEDAITLYSRVTKKFYKKNEKRLTNDYISGTPDLYDGETIETALRIVDAKSSWDIFTFFRNNAKSLNKMYYWQLQGYMWLTGAASAQIAYCLVNIPDVLIADQKRRLQWKMGIIDETKAYLEGCAEIDKLSIYDDIPISERLITFDVDRNEDDIVRLYERIKVCREYMNVNLFKYV